MPVAAWIAFIILVIVVVLACFGFYLAAADEIEKKGIIISCIVTLVIVVGLYFGMHWYYNNTAAGQRALIDDRSNLSSGLDRTITVYTADGNVIAQYSGKIDIEGNDGGYVLFDFDGKRYIYYNCFIESIADIS